MDKNNLEVSSGLKILAKTSVIVFISIVLSKLISYVYRIVIARYYGPEEYGLFSLGIMLLGWFSAVAALGLTEGVIRYASLYHAKDQKDRLSYLLRITCTIIICTTILAGGIMYFASDFIAGTFFHSNDLAVYFRVFAFLIPIGVFGHLFLAFIRAFEMVGWYSFIFNVLQNVTKISALTILIFLGYNSNALMTSYFLGVSVILIAGYLVSKYKISEIFNKTIIAKEKKKEIAISLISYSWPLFLYGVVVNIYFWIDSFVIGYFKSPTDVGIYNAAIPIAMLMSLASELFMTIFLPIITKEYAKKKKTVIEELSKQVTKWIFALNLPLLILMLFFPEALINILFGQEYLAAADSLRILAIGTFIFSLNTVSHNLVIMTGKSKVVLTNFIITCLVNLVLNLLLIPKFGIFGAALATTLSYVFLYLLFLFEVIKYLQIIPLRRKMLLVLISSILPALLLIYLKNKIETSLISMIIIVFLFGFVYGVSLLVTKSLDRNDIELINSFLKKINIFKKSV